MTLFGKLADQQHSRLVSRNNHLIRAWMLISFIEHSKGTRWGSKVKRLLVLQISEKTMATHSSTLAWKIPWAEEAAVHGVTKSQTWLSDFTFTSHFHALKKELATHSSVLALRIPGMGEPGGLPSMGSHRVGHDWSDLAADLAAVLQISPGMACLWEQMC